MDDLIEVIGMTCTPGTGVGDGMAVRVAVGSGRGVDVGAGVGVGGAGVAGVAQLLTSSNIAAAMAELNDGFITSSPGERAAARGRAEASIRRCTLHGLNE